MIVGRIEFSDLFLRKASGLFFEFDDDVVALDAYKWTQSKVPEWFRFTLALYSDPATFLTLPGGSADARHLSMHLMRLYSKATASSRLRNAFISIFVGGR